MTPDHPGSAEQSKTCQRHQFPHHHPGNKNRPRMSTSRGTCCPSFPQLVPRLLRLCNLPHSRPAPPRHSALTPELIQRCQVCRREHRQNLELRPARKALGSALGQWPSPSSGCNGQLSNSHIGHDEDGVGTLGGHLVLGEVEGLEVELAGGGAGGAVGPEVDSQCCMPKEGTGCA